jgi:uncharacterized Tic20 family protein
MSRLHTYQQFFSPEQAEPVLTILKEHEIPFEFTQSRKIVDTVIAGESSSDHLYELKIPAAQFEEVNQLLRHSIQVNIEELDADYYLFSFSEEELKDILRKPDEWSNQDFSIARALLAKKGITYTDDELAALRNERLGVLSRPEQVHKNLVMLGFVAAFFGAPIGLIMGAVIWQVKKTLPNGRREFVYDFSSRQTGKTIFIISLVIFVIALVSGVTGLFSALFNVTSLYERPLIPLG